jgi:hypothetical protein
VDEVAEHLASMARLCMELGGIATEVTSTERLDPPSAAIIRRLAPAIAGRYRLDVRCELRGEMLTVAFRRRPRSA